MKQYEAAAPFAGFYESVHNQTIDSQIIELASDRIENANIVEFLNDNVNFGAVFESYAQAYTEYLNEQLNIGLVFNRLVSPRFYNYSTDKIIVMIKQKHIKKMFSQLVTNKKGKIMSYRADFREILRNQHVSFIPDTWKSLKTMLNSGSESDRAVIMDTLVRLYCEYSLEEIDHNFIDSTMGFYDNLNDSILSTLDAEKLAQYEALISEVTQ